MCLFVLGGGNDGLYSKEILPEKTSFLSSYILERETTELD